MQTRVRTLAEAEGYVDFLWLDEPVIDEAAWAKAHRKDDRAAAMLDATIGGVGRRARWTPEAAEGGDGGGGAGGRLRQRRGRAAAGARRRRRSGWRSPAGAVGPPLFESVVALGRERTLARLRKARATLG